MYRLIHEKPFKRSVPSIPKGTRSGLTNYTTYLSKAYWIDTTRCYLNGRLNCDLLFELFGAYSGKSASEVRRDMINYTKTMKDDVINSCHTGMRLKGYKSLEAWIDIMERESTPGDEFCLYLLGKTYFRHVFVMTGENVWCTCETDRPLSIKELLEISSVHLVYLGQGQYGLLRKRCNTIQQHTVQQVRQQRTPSVGTLFNRACNYRRVQSRPLNLSGIPNARTVSCINRGRGRGAFSNYTNRGRVHVNPVQQLQPQQHRQVPSSYNAPGFTISSEYVDQVNPLVSRTSVPIRHPEVEQLVTELLGRTEKVTKSSSAYKYPEVEQVVTNLLGKKSPVTVDLTDDPNSTNKDQMSKDVARSMSESDKPVHQSNSTIENDYKTVSPGKAPEPSLVITISSSPSKDCHQIETSDKENLGDDKSHREDGELVSADDCSTSDTTEELLDEMGLLPKLGNSSKTESDTSNVKDVPPGKDISIKSIKPDTGRKDIPAITPDSESEEQDNRVNAAAVALSGTKSENGIVSTKQETETAVLNSDQTTQHKTTNDEAIVIASDTELTVLTNADTVIVKTESKDYEETRRLDNATILVSDTEITDNDTVIVKCESETGESNSVDPQHTFHALQEQILNLQCKVEMHKVKKENLVSLGTITLFSDTDENDMSSEQKPDSTGTKLATPKGEPLTDPDNDGDTESPINKPKNKRKRNLIESSTDSDEDDNIPLAELRVKLAPVPLPAKTVTRPKIKQPKRKLKKRRFTTKPPPAQTSKPTVNRGNAPVPDTEEDNDNASQMDSENGGETSVTNRSDSGYNTTTSQHDRTTKTTETANKVEPSTSKTSPSVTTGSGKKRKRNFYCIKCDVVEPSMKELNEHFRNTHDWVHCHSCGKPFPTPSALAKHMYTHGPNLLQCDQCEKQFPFESQLVSHKISHDEEGQFPCDQCPKRMKNKSDLKKHLSAHTDETYECQYCDEYVASDIRNLKGHLKTHDNLLRYVCRYCAKRFKHYNQRRRHQLKPNGCPKMPKRKA